MWPRPSTALVKAAVAASLPRSVLFLPLTTTVVSRYNDSHSFPFPLLDLLLASITMRSAIAISLLALPLTALGAHQERAHRRRHAGLAHSPAYMRRSANYTLQNKFVGEDFL